MARDILKASDAIDRAMGVNAGLDALACLMQGCNESDIPDGKSIAELILAVHKEINSALIDADQYLRQ